MSLESLSQEMRAELEAQRAILLSLATNIEQLDMSICKLLQRANQTEFSLAWLMDRDKDGRKSTEADRLG